MDYFLLLDMFLAAHTQNQVVVLDTVNYEVINTLPIIAREIYAMEFAPWEENLLAVGCHCEVHLWNIADNTELGTLDHEARVYMMAFGKRNGAFADEFLVTRCIQKMVRKWNLATYELMFQFSVHTLTHELYVAWYGRFIITTTIIKSDKVFVWDTESGDKAVELENAIERNLIDDDGKLATTWLQGCRGNDTLFCLASKEHIPMILRFVSDSEVTLSTTWAELPPGTTASSDNYTLSGDGSKLFCMGSNGRSMIVLDTLAMSFISAFSVQSHVDYKFYVNFSGNHVCYCSNSNSNEGHGHSVDDDGCWVVFDVQLNAVVRALSDQAITDLVYSSSNTVILM